MSAQNSVTDIYAVRDALLRWIGEHRASCSDEDCQEPESLMAWLCHCVGVTDLDMLRHYFLEYEMRCGDQACGHARFRRDPAQKGG